MGEVFCSPSFFFFFLVLPSGACCILLGCFGSSFGHPFVFIYTIVILPIYKKVPFKNF